MDDDDDDDKSVTTFEDQDDQSYEEEEEEFAKKKKSKDKKNESKLPASGKPVKKNGNLVRVEKTVDQAKKMKQKAVPQKKKREVKRGKIQGG